MEFFFKGLGKEYRGPLYSSVWVGLLRNFATMISTDVAW